MTSRLAAALLGAAAVLLAPGTAAAAEPAQLGALYVDPATGADDTPLELLTTGGCPAPATNVVGRLHGKGFPAAGQIVIGNTDVGVSRSGAFSVVPADTLRAFAAMQASPAPLTGPYRIVLSCQEALGSASLGDYVGTLVFSSARRYAARNPTTKPVPAAPAPGSVPLPGQPGIGAAAPQGTPGGPGSQPGSGAHAQPGADQQAGGAGSAGTSGGEGIGQDGSSLSLLWAGVAGFLLAALLPLGSRLLRGRTPARSAVT